MLKNLLKSFKEKWIKEEMGKRKKELRDNNDAIVV